MMMMMVMMMMMMMMMMIGPLLSVCVCVWLLHSFSNLTSKEKKTTKK